MSVLNSIKPWFNDLRGKPRELSYEESTQVSTESARDRETLNQLHNEQIRSRGRQGGL